MSNGERIPAPYVGGDALLELCPGTCDAHDLTEAALVMVDIIKTLAHEVVHGQQSSRESIGHAISILADTADLYGQASLRLMSESKRLEVKRAVLS